MPTLNSVCHECFHQMLGHNDLTDPVQDLADQDGVGLIEDFEIALDMEQVHRVMTAAIMRHQVEHHNI